MDLDDAQAVVARHALYDYYVNHYRGMERMYLASLFEHLAEYEPTRVLEIGPGWGTTAVWLVSRGHDVTVIDLMPVGRLMAQSLVDELGVAYVHSDIEDAAAPENADLGTFDVVVMTQVIHHLAWRPDRALRHVRELMSEGGILVSSVLDRQDYPDLDSAFGDNWMDIPEWRSTERCEDTVKCMYTEQTFRQLLGTEFREVEVWKPTDSAVLFAKCSNSPRSRLGRLVDVARGFKPVGTRP
ncbi:MAG: class I SAM-dependent methyltransferase [Acidimicrobiia bacterium]